MTDKSGNCRDSLRVLMVVQPSASHYRAPLLTELAKSEKCSFVFLGKQNRAVRKGERDSDEVRSAGQEVLDRVRTFEEVKLFKKFKWQKGVVRNTITEPADLFIFEGNVYIVSTWLAVFVAKLKRKRTAFWGHGWKRPEGTFKLRTRKLFYRLVDGHFVYGTWAKNYAQSVGLNSGVFYPVFNSVYPASELATTGIQKNNVSVTKIEAKPGISLIFSGRLTKRHEVELAILAVQLLRGRGMEVKLAIVGDGSERGSLQGMVKQGVPGIEFLGAVYDASSLKDLYERSDFALSPGASGLNVIQAMGFGVPVIAAVDHRDSGPEIEALSDGHSGLVFSSGSVGSLADVIVKASNLSEAERLQMGERARDIVLARYTTEKHAAAIVDSIGRVMNAIESDLS